MAKPSMTLNIPPHILERAQEVAAATNQSVETVLLDTLAIHFGSQVDENIDPDKLESYADELLWAVVYRRPSPSQEKRLYELVELGNQGKLSEEDELELADLLKLVDRQTLLRSKALLLLHQRGHDVHAYLQSGS